MNLTQSISNDESAIRPLFARVGIPSDATFVNGMVFWNTPEGKTATTIPSILARMGLNPWGELPSKTETDCKWRPMGDIWPEDGERCQLCGDSFISVHAFVWREKHGIWELESFSDDDHLKYDGAWWTHWRPFVDESPNALH